MNKDLLVKWGIPSFAVAFIVAVWMVGTTPVKDGMTAVQLFHDHSMRYIIRNQEAVQVAMDYGRTEIGKKDSQFKKYLSKDALLKLYQLEGKMPEAARQRMLIETQEELNEHIKAVEDAEKKLGLIDLRWAEYRIPVNYNGDS
jgi:hypothetical protein